MFGWIKLHSFGRRIAVLVLLVGVSLAGGLVWFHFGFLGRRPWNDHAYSNEEIQRYAKQHGLWAKYNTVLDRDADRYSVDDNGGDTAIIVPLYRVFDSAGRRLHLHCCFEAVDALVDSIVQSHSIQTESQSSLDAFLSHVHCLDRAPPLTGSDFAHYRYVILYYWDTTLELNMEKLRHAMAKVQQYSNEVAIVLINTNVQSIVKDEHKPRSSDHPTRDRSTGPQHHVRRGPSSA